MLVIEVLSPSTEKNDTIEKLSAYQQYPTIQEILFVDSRSRSVELYSRVGALEWKYFLYKDELDSIKLASIDISLSVKDIYHKVYLELEE